MMTRNQFLGKPAVWTFTLLLLGGFALAAVKGAQRSDSGWVVSTPTTNNYTAATPPNLQERILLHHLLQETQTPLITGGGGGRFEGKASPVLGSSPALTGHDPLRLAVRPDGIDGWRPAGPMFVPLNEQPVQDVAPQLEQSARPAAQPPSTVDDPELAAEPTDAVGADSTASATPAESDIDDEAAPLDESGEALLEESPEDEAADESAADAADESAGDAAESTDDTSEAAEPGDVSPPASEAPAPPPLTRQLMSLRSRVRSVLNGYYRKTLNSRDNDPWEVMHGMLAYGVQSRVQQGGSRGKPITSVGWLCYNKPCKNQSLLYVTPQGELRAKYGVGLQGHLGQFLAMLAQCRVSPDYPIRVGTNEFTIHDLIEAEKKTCYPKSELTFKLISFQYYLDLNEKWVNDQGVDWDIPRLIREELAQPIRGAACGGTHRLSSLSLTVKARVRRGEPLDGEYARAAEFVQKYHQYAFRLQNRDGSLSTAWFQGRGDDSDINRRIKTTGHILEWLCYSLSDEELRQPQTLRAVTYLANLMYSKYNNEWEVGPMSHAVHALLVYDERVFQPFDDPSYKVAYRPHPSTASRTRQASPRR